MAAKDYNGTITISGSKFAPDNQQISVLLHVTTEPIAQLSSSSVSFSIAQGANKQSTPVAITNAGQGTLTVSSVTAATANGGAWLSALAVTGGVTITANPTGLTPGTYNGTVNIASNAGNSSVEIPVQLTVQAQGPPFAFAGGAVNNGTFANGEPLAQGDIAAVFGNQFTYGEAQGATTLPLQTKMNSTPGPAKSISRCPLMPPSPTAAPERFRLSVTANRATSSMSTSMPACRGSSCTAQATEW
jgi:hypothetical protein